MASIKISERTEGASHLLVAEGPSPHDIRMQLTQKLVTGINGKIDMEVARQLVSLGWTPPPGHPVLDDEKNS